MSDKHVQQTLYPLCQEVEVIFQKQYTCYTAAMVNLNFLSILPYFAALNTYCRPIQRVAWGPIAALYKPLIILLLG